MPAYTPSPSPSIRWVNHASFVLTCGEVRLLTDPWLFGRAFNDGWAHISQTKFSLDDFRNITHIWFSHEHPDHFAPPVLQQIPEQVRRGIVVIFQETIDRKVIRYCQSLGFEVKELPTHQWHALGADVRVMCGKVPYIDSWLLIEAGKHRILNANDCVVDGAGIAHEIAEHTGKVDVLLTQFSYANWIGNPDDVSERRDAAREKLERVRIQIEAFHPEYVIPFASMVYFCHAENAYLNDEMNSPRDAYDFIRTEAGAQPIVLYPDDEWVVGSPRDSTESLNAYDRDTNLAHKTFVTSPPVAVPELSRLCLKYISRFSRANNRLLMRAMRMAPLRYFPPITIYLMDLEKTVEFDWKRGLREVAATAPDVTMGSQSLAYAFQFDWGYETLEVNGRFRATVEGHAKMVKAFFLGPLNNTGRHLRLRTLLDRRFVGRALRKMKALRGK